MTHGKRTTRRNRLRHASTAALLLLAGCQSASVRSTELLEARLRRQQQSLDTLQDSLARKDSQLAAARRESAALRNELARSDSVPDSTQTPPALISHEHFQVERLEIVRLMSGGLDRDEHPGDELLSVLIAPQDVQGETHRVPGELTVSAIDFTKQNSDQRIGTWEYGLDETAELWHSGVVGRGFRIIVPLKTWPAGEELTIHARFTTPDDRQFDATGTVRLTPPAAQSATLPAPTAEAFKRPKAG